VNNGEEGQRPRQETIRRGRQQRERREETIGADPPAPEDPLPQGVEPGGQEAPKPAEPATTSEMLAGQAGGAEDSEEESNSLEEFAAELVRARNAKDKGEQGWRSQLREIAEKINALPKEEERQRIYAYARDSSFQSKALEQTITPSMRNQMEGEERIETDQEVGGEKPPSESLEDWESQRRQETGQSIGEIYQREAAESEQFIIDEDTRNEAVGMLDSKRAEVLAEEERAWLAAHAGQFPELKGEDIESFDKARIREYTKGNKEFLQELSRNIEWQDLSNLKSILQESRGLIPPHVKLAILENLPPGETREKMWQFLTGENLEEKAGAEVQTDQTKEEYVDSRYGQETEAFRHKREKELGLMSEERWWLDLQQDGERKEEFLAATGFDRQKSRTETIGGYMQRYDQEFRRYYQKKFLNEYKRFIESNALRELGLRKRELTKKEGLIGFRKEKKTGVVEIVDAQGNVVETLSSSDTEEFLRGRLTGKIDQEIRTREVNVKEGLGRDWDGEWEELKNEKKETIIDTTVENGEGVMDDIYTKIEQERLATYMAQKKVERDPEKRKQVEEAFGKGVAVDLAGLGAKVMSLEEGGKLKGVLKEDKKLLKDIFQSSGLFENRGFRNAFGERLRDEKMQEAYGQAMKKKYGVLELLFDMFLGISESVSPARSPRTSTARTGRRR